MKTNVRHNPPRLFDWIAARLPKSLEAKSFMVGYGWICGIWRRGEVPGFFKRAFDSVGDPLAEISGYEVRLNYPEYVSDFEDLLRRFESETKIETTLSYWASPKDQSSAAHDKTKDGT